MTNNKKIVGLVSLLFLVLVMVSIYLIIYSLDYRSVITPYSQGTRISNIYISGKTSSQVEEELNKRIENWKKNFNIELTYQNSSYIIEIDDPNIFSFNISRTISNIENGKETNYEKGINIIDVKFKKENYIDELLTEHYDELKINDFDNSFIEAKLIKKVSFLANEIYIDLGTALNEESIKDNKVGDEIQILSGVSKEDSRYDILDELILEYFSEPIEIRARTQFSFNDYIIDKYEKYLSNNILPDINIDEINTIYNYFFYNDELNRLATGIYQTILPTNFNNIGKSISDTLPTYARENVETSNGMSLIIREAAVNLHFYYNYINKKITDIKFENNEDLTFYNPNNHSYYLLVDLIDDKFVFQLYGPTFINDYYIDSKIRSYDSGYHSILKRVTYYNNVEIKSEVLTEDIY